MKLTHFHLLLPFIQIDVLETFNPLGLTSGLFDSLKCQTKGNRSMSQAKKREIEKVTLANKYVTTFPD